MNDFRLYSDELSHHGVTGMKWGQRNGPPYPLTTWQQKAGNAVARGKAALGKAFSEAGKKAKIKVESEVARKKAEHEDIQRRKADAAKRKRLVAMAKRHPELLSDQELQQLNNRAQQEKNFKSNYIQNKGKNIVKETGNSVFKDVAKPAVVAVGKAAVISSFSHGDFKTVALHQLNQVWDKQSNQKQSSNEKPKKTKTKGNFKVKP